MIKCMICGRNYNRILSSHLVKHNLTREEYSIRFPEANFVSEEYRLNNLNAIRKNLPKRKKTFASPEYREKKRIIHSRPDIREASRQRILKTMSDPIKEAERRRKIRETTNTDEFKQRVSIRQRRYMEDPKWKERWLTLRVPSPEGIARQREAIKKCWEDPEWRDRQLEKFAVGNTPEKFRKHSETMKAYFSDPEWKRRFLKGLNRHPNNFEMDVYEVLKPLGFEFTGDFSFWIGVGGGINFNPDFIHRQSKLVVEALGEYWHTEEETQERKRLMGVAGWTMLHVWYEDFYSNSEPFIKQVKAALQLVGSYDIIFTSSSTGA